MNSTDATKEIAVSKIVNRLSILTLFTESEISRVLYSIPDFDERECIFQWYYDVQEAVKALAKELH